MIAQARARIAAARRELHARRRAAGRLLRAFARAYPDAFVVEIGANDGHQSDHLRRLIERGGWRGLMVEPDAEAFARLTRNCPGGGRFAFENAAIAHRDGPVSFYRVAPPAPGARRELIGSYDLLGSLSRETLLAEGWIEGVEERIEQTEVRGLTLETLWRQHHVDNVDLLLIDTEGYDLEILRQLDFAALRPRLIGYEHALLAGDDRREAARLLRANGYDLLSEGFDTWCLDPLGDRLTARWRRLRPLDPPVVMRSG